jgi:FAD/FMN-containing dehydrogenase/Fe-S oxidoreductase
MRHWHLQCPPSFVGDHRIVDEQQRGRLADDLKGFFKGALHFDALTRALYSTDASIFQVQPLGVAAPRDEADVQALVRYASENQLPLVPRGAGTGVAGESLGAGLVVDLSKHFRQIIEVGSDTIRIQPGLTLQEVNTRLALDGRRFAPDPASAGTCTLGGMLATNASGARAIKHGYTRDHVAALRLVLDNGDAVSAGRESVHLPNAVNGTRWNGIINNVAALLDQNTPLIQSSGPRVSFNRCGYLLKGVLHNNTVDVPRLVIGSEGTLALFTEATLRTVPLPGGQALLLLGFSSLDGALEAVQRTLPTQPSACELIDRRLLSLARASEASNVAALVPAEAEAALLVEYEADSPREARDTALEIADRLFRHERLALYAMPAFDPDAVERLWHLREVALPTLYSLRGGPQPVPFVEDVAVPLDCLARYLHGVQDVLKHHDTTASFLIHAGAGQVHTRPFLDLERPADIARLTAIAEAIHGLALELGGTISTQHGTGLARTPWVARQYGSLFGVFRQLKEIFDPRGIFNPGKIVGADPQLPPWPLRTVLPVEPPTAGLENGDVAPPQSFLHWHPGDIRRETSSCNGCGHCRLDDSTHRMCPIFHASRDEVASPRAKANLFRHLLQEKGDPRLLSSDEVRAVADLCVNCRMCALECPAHVDVPRLMLEAKAANVAEHGLDRRDWFPARIETFARYGSAFAPLVNHFLANRSFRWLMCQLFNVSATRRLPRLAARPFLRRARRRGWSRKPRSGRPKIAYFVDIYANFIDPQIAEAVVAVLHHNGFDVFVPPEQRGCGMAALAHGDLEAAREAAEHNLRLFGEAAREGYTILCSEPTAALMLRRDYLDLVDDPDAKLVAAQTVEFTSFLWDLHQQGRLRTDFHALNLSLGHHVPCHLKALPPRSSLTSGGTDTVRNGVATGPALLSLIPGMCVHTIDVSCSGMAGTFGLRADNYATSLAAGRRMLNEVLRPRVLFGSTECGTCRMQMEDGAGKRTLHPAQYLALAYGLLPAVARRLDEPMHQLVLR